MDNKDVMSYKDWMITILLLCIPLVGIVLMIIWALDSNGNQSRTNFCKAQLTYVAISVVLGFISIFAFGGLLAMIANGL